MIGESLHLKRKGVGMMAQNLFYNIKTIVRKLRPEKTTCKDYDVQNGFTMCIEKGMIERFVNLIIYFLSIFKILTFFQVIILLRLKRCSVI